MQNKYKSTSGSVTRSLDDYLVPKNFLSNKGVWTFTKTPNFIMDGSSTSSTTYTFTNYEFLQSSKDEWSVLKAYNPDFVLGIKSDGSIWMKSPHYTPFSASTLPQIEKLSLNNWKWIDVVACSDYTDSGTTIIQNLIAIREDGTMWGTGYNRLGFLGVGNKNDFRSSLVQIGSDTNWSKISVYTSNNSSSSLVGTYFMALKTDGSLWAWGRNINGVIPGAVFDSIVISPVQIQGSWKSVSPDKYHVLGIKTDNTLWNWGLKYSNHSNVIHDSGVITGIPSQISSPVQIGTSSNWGNLSMNYIFGNSSHYEFFNPSLTSHKFVKQDGTLWAWGKNNYAQLGLGDIFDRESPVQVGTDTNWKFVNTGDSICTVALKTNGTLWRAGTFTAGTVYSTPVQIGSKSDWVYVDGNYNHIYSIDSEGTLYRNHSPMNSSFIESVTYDESGVSILDGESLTEYPIPTYGNNNDGYWTIPVPWGIMHPLGTGSSIHIESNSMITLSGTYTSNAGSITTTNPSGRKIFIGTGDNSCQRLLYGIKGITPNRTLQIRYEGTNSTTGTLGNPNIVWELTLFENQSDRFKLSVGKHARPAGLWGVYSSSNTLLYNFSGKTSEFTTSFYYTGVADPTTKFTNVKNVSFQAETEYPISMGVVQYYYALAVKNDGTLWAWGENRNGVFGDGLTSSTTINSPKQIGSDTNWSSVSVSNQCALAIKTDGTLWAWGNNNNFLLGLGDQTNRSSPVQVGVATNWSKVKPGNIHSLGIKTDGTLWVWGNSQRGETGYAAGINVSTPVQYGTDTNWYDVLTTYRRSILAKKTGSSITLWHMGAITNCVTYPSVSATAASSIEVIMSSPTQIGADVNWSKCHSSNSQNYAIKTDGTLWAWGNNYYGDLGIGTTSNRSSPTQVGSLTNWKEISSFNSSFSSNSTVFAVKTDGTLWTWGDLQSGIITKGSNTSRSSPVQIGSNTDWNSFAISKNNFSILIQKTPYTD